MKVSKNRLRKLIILTLTLLFIISACGRIVKDSENDTVQTPEVSPTVAPTPTPIPTQTPTPTSTPAPSPTPTPTPTPSQTPELGEPIEFKDEWFGALMLESVRSIEGNEDRECVYESDLKGITSLEIKPFPSDFVTELDSFKIYYGTLDNEAKFDGNIQYLDYWDTEFIATLEDLKYFPELKQLRISGIRASDFSPVWELEQLESLSIHQCYFVKDLSGISKLKNLKILYLGGWYLSEGIKYGGEYDTNEWIEYERRKHRTALVENGVSECEIDISFLKEMTWIKYLSLTCFDVDWSTLSAMSGLKALNIASCRSNSNISELKGLDNLECMWITDSQINGVDLNIEDFPSLKYLSYSSLHLNLSGTDLDMEKYWQLD